MYRTLSLTRRDTDSRAGEAKHHTELCVTCERAYGLEPRYSRWWSLKEQWSLEAYLFSHQVPKSPLVSNRSARDYCTPYALSMSRNWDRSAAVTLNAPG